MDEKDKDIFSYTLVFPAVGFIIGGILMLIIGFVLDLIGIEKEKIEIYGIVISSMILLVIVLVLRHGKLTEKNENNQAIKPSYQISDSLKRENEKIKRGQDEKKREEALVRRHRLIPENYIKPFLFDAERKYEKRDKYGNQNIQSLEKEISDYLVMIAKQGGDAYQINIATAYAKGRSYPPLNEDYKWLVSYLREEFHKYHTEKQKKISSGVVDIPQMTGVEFEKYLANIFKSSGYIVEMTPESGDQGADIIAEKEQRRLVIQAKRYKGNVGNGAIQEVIGAIRYYEGTEGWVITNSIFTNSARELARVNNITLIDGMELENLKKLI